MLFDLVDHFVLPRVGAFSVLFLCIRFVHFASTEWLGIVLLLHRVHVSHHFMTNIMYGTHYTVLFLLFDR